MGLDCCTLHRKVRPVLVTSKHQLFGGWGFATDLTRWTYNTPLDYSAGFRKVHGKKEMEERKGKRNGKE